MKLYVFLFCLIIVSVSQKSECSKLIQQLIEDIISLDISKQSAPSIMYSGVTTNNPGQKAECENLAKFNYFLITISNATLNSQTYTGLCVPKECNKYEIEIALEDYITCQVLDFPSDSLNSLQITGVVILLTWLAVLTLSSIFQSCRREATIQPKKNQQQESLNQLSKASQEDSSRDDFKIFNFYEGYHRLFMKAQNKLTAAVSSLAIFSLLVSIEFSSRQVIASNQQTSYSLFNSIIGVLVCNTQIAISTILFMFGINLASNILHAKSFHEVFRFLFDQLAIKWVLLVVTSLFLYGVLGYIDEPLSAIFEKHNTAQCTTVMWEIWLLFRHVQLDCKVCLPWLFLLQADILLTIFASPFVVMFRTKKILGYCLLTGLIAISLLLSYAFLDNQAISFLPYQLFNMHPEFTINYQTNILVRIAPYFTGIIFGFLVYDGLNKHQAERTLALKIKGEASTQYFLHIVGVAIMVVAYLLILNYLTPKTTTTATYIYIILTPMLFLFGLSLFLLPIAWEGKNAIATLMDKIFLWKIWAHIQKISSMLLIFGPAIIAYTTFSMQNSIYYDLQTIITYLLGDLVIIYILCALAAAAIHSQLHFINNWIINKLLHSKKNLLLIQD